jgi:hypothetical protein
VKTPNVTINKSLTETYKVFFDGRWQATIMIEDSSGLLQIQSEYGHFSHYWGTSGRSKGNTFKQELIRFGLDYVQNKLSYNDDLGRHFFPDRTVKRIREDILEARRQHRINWFKARLFWDESEELGEQTVDGFHAQLCEMELFEAIYDNDPFQVPFVTGDHPRLVRFMKEVYPHFRQMLIDEQAQQVSV